MVGIGIAQHESVAAIQEVKQRGDVEGVARRARGGRWNVEVDESGWFIVDEDGDLLQFYLGVSWVNVTEVDVGVTESVMNEEEEASTPITCTIVTNNGEAIEAGIPGRRTQLGFLYRSYYHIVSFQESTQLCSGRSDPVTVELKEARRRNGSARSGSRIRVNGAAHEEEDEDKTATESRRRGRETRAHVTATHAL